MACELVCMREVGEAAELLAHVAGEVLRAHVQEELVRPVEGHIAELTGRVGGHVRRQFVLVKGIQLQWELPVRL